MKKFDLLGERGAPMRLLFLKYLIDNDYHQGLYNILAVIGDTFYVRNDIDKEEIPYLVKLKNDVSTNNRWQFFIMRDSKSPK